jgi:hypothetical protein
MTPAGLAASNDEPPYAVAGSGEMQQMLLGGFCERSRVPVSVDDLVEQFSESAATGLLDVLARERKDVPSGTPCHLRVAACAQVYVNLALERGFIRKMGADEERDPQHDCRNSADIEDLGRVLIEFARTYDVTMDDSNNEAFSAAIVDHVRDIALSTAAQIVVL